MTPIGAIRALLEGGAELKGRNELDETSLDPACKRSSVSGVDLLLRRGADEDLTDIGGEFPADVIGASEENGDSDEEIAADDQRIRRTLEHAPADRSWRRRGWLVLSRSCPTRVKIANGRNSSNDCPAKVARVSGEDSGGGGEETEDDMMVDWRDLVGKLIGLEADGLFRLVVGFLRGGGHTSMVKMLAGEMAQNQDVNRAIAIGHLKDGSPLLIWPSQLPCFVWRLPRKLFPVFSG
ncbi:unnamed protein product [Ectocarpus sp. 4 AP-2014]